MQLVRLTGQMALVNDALEADHGTTLADYLAGQRAAGISYDNIARQVTDLIGVAGFSVGYQTIRRWCQRLGI